jgi:hypothetical protein
MKLAKALKLKNKLAGEIALAQRLINESNVTENDNSPPHDVKYLYDQMVENQEELAELKGKIAVANGPISAMIFEMSELKARIAFLRAMPTKHGSFVTEGRYGTESITRIHRATFKAAWVEEEAQTLSERIEELQDSIDEFNAKTSI